jgi:hypothetical protein
LVQSFGAVDIPALVAMCKHTHAAERALTRTFSDPASAANLSQGYCRRGALKPARDFIDGTLRYEFAFAKEKVGRVGGFCPRTKRFSWQCPHGACGEWFCRSASRIKTKVVAPHRLHFPPFA